MNDENPDLLNLRSEGFSELGFEEMSRLMIKSLTLRKIDRFGKLKRKLGVGKCLLNNRRIGLGRLRL